MTADRLFDELMGLSLIIIIKACQLAVSFFFLFFPDTIYKEKKKEEEAYFKQAAVRGKWK